LGCNHFITKSEGKIFSHFGKTELVGLGDGHPAGGRSELKPLL